MPDTAHPLLSPEIRRMLLAVARDSIQEGLTRGRPLAVEPDEFPPELREQRASFVTLERGGQLRGCIGHLEAIEPLVADVAENAFAAAFRDPRFPPVSPGEFSNLDIHLSVLTPARPMVFSSEKDLVSQLRPKIDGLILEDGPARGTFLPSVWESLPDPQDFLAHLKRKAGLPADHWSPGVKVYRYETESFS